MQPSKYNAKRVQIIVEAIGRGHSIRSAAGLGDVSHQQVLEWISKRPEFAAKVEGARARYLDGLISTITDAAPEDPRLALEVAARKDPDEWAPRSRHEVSGPSSGPIKVELKWPTGPTPPAEK